MKKTTISLPYDTEKLAALRIYLAQRGSNVESELEKALDALYGRVVPAGVREYFDLRSRNGSVDPPTRRPRNSEQRASVSEDSGPSAQ